MRYLTARQLLLIHSRLLDENGGSAGVRDQGRIESVIAAPKQIVFGEEQYKTVFEKAGTYIRNIIKDHPFVDGNKRTAMLTGLVFLENNNYVLTFKKGEVERMAIEIATQKMEISEIAKWLGQHSTQLKK